MSAQLAGAMVLRGVVTVRCRNSYITCGVISATGSTKRKRFFAWQGNRLIGSIEQKQDPLV